VLLITECDEKKKKKKERRTALKKRPGKVNTNLNVLALVIPSPREYLLILFVSHNMNSFERTTSEDLDRWHP